MKYFGVFIKTYYAYYSIFGMFIAEGWMFVDGLDNKEEAKKFAKYLEEKYNLETMIEELTIYKKSESAIEAFEKKVEGNEEVEE